MQAAQRQLHPGGGGGGGGGGQAAQGGGQDTLGYLHPLGGASCPEAASPLGGKLPRVQDKPVHWPRGSNPQPPDHQTDAHPTEPPRPAKVECYASVNVDANEIQTEIYLFPLFRDKGYKKHM